MAQDTRTTNDIINNAFYFLGEVTPDVIPSASLVARGLFLLNNMLDAFSRLGVYIPLIKEIDVQLNPGQGTYVVSNIVPADFNFNRIVELDFVVITLQNIQFPVRIIDRATHFNNIRYPQILQRPGQVFLDRLELQTNLTFYPSPDLAYATMIRAKFMLDRLSLFQVINELPPYYYDFLITALARKLSNYYPSSRWKEQQESDYQMMLQDIKAGAEINLLINPDELLMLPYRYGYYTRFGVL